MSDETEYTNFQVAKGCIRIPSNFTGAADGTFSRRNEFLRPGDAIPEGILSDREAQGLLASGTIKLIATPAAAEAAQDAAQRHLSKWDIDPATLGRKTHEDLLVMIQDIDPQFPLEQVAEEADARRQLSKDFDPEFRQSHADVLAADPVSRLSADGVQGGSAGPLSQQAAAQLDELRERAQTPEASGGADTEFYSQADAQGDQSGAEQGAQGDQSGAEGDEGSPEDPTEAKANADANAADANAASTQG